METGLAATATTQVRLLFVDDEPAVVRSLQRVLSRQCPDWSGTYLTDARTALELLERERFDAVVSDLQMPAMSGADLLARVQHLHPDTVRVVLSGGAREETLRAVPFAHQFLPKPFDPRKLRLALEQTLEFGKRLRSPQLRELIIKSNRLPTPPRLHQQLRRLLMRAEVSIREVAGIVETDPSVSAQVLRVATSALFGLPANTASVATAVAYLGISTTEALVLSSEVLHQFAPAKGVRGFDLESTQRHGVVAAQITRCLLGATPEAERGFLAALLHDVGRVILACRAPTRFAEANLAIESGAEPMAAELAALGCHHGEVGAFLLGLWGLPQDLVEAVAAHHQLPPNFDVETAEAARSADSGERLRAAVFIANRLAHDPEDPLVASGLEFSQLEQYQLITSVSQARSLARALQDQPRSA